MHSDWELVDVGGNLSLFLYKTSNYLQSAKNVESNEEINESR